MDTTHKAKKILVIEDEQPIARAMYLRFNRAGFEVTNAMNGSEGLAFMEKDHFDLILLDLVMPQLDGFAVLTVMKEKHNTTPVFVTSNLSQPEDEKRVRELGAEDFIIKSNTPIPEMVERVSQRLGAS